MSEVMAFLVPINLAIAAASFLVLVLRPSVRRIFGPQAVYALWLSVPAMALAVLLPARTVEALTTTARDPSPATGSFIGQPLAEATVAAAGLDLAGSAAAIWLTGVGVGFAVLLFRQVRFLRRLGDQRPSPGSDRTVLAERSDIGPAVIGLWRPRIVLPSDFDARFAPAEQQLMLAHEQVHLARGDILVNAVLASLQCLFWFNLPLHVAARALRIDQELACDAVVLGQFPKRRRVYAEALLKAQLAPLGLPLGCYWPARSEGPLQLRIALLTAAPRSRGRRTLGAGLAATVVAAAGLSAWAAQPATPVLPANAPAERQTYHHDWGDERTLAEAAEAGDVVALKALVVAGRVDPNVRVIGDGTPLILAARSGGLEAVRVLLDHGADPNLPMHGDGNPLIAAAIAGDRAVARELIARGARVDDNVASDETALITAARTGHLGVVEELVDGGADVNLKVEVWRGGGLIRSPLSEAQRIGRTDIATYLRAHGAGP
jgi:beta-lactamase regulating signal transducer with metallopeptidase domain